MFERFPQEAKALLDLHDFCFWPSASVAAMQRFGRDRRHSGHSQRTLKPTLMTLCDIGGETSLQRSTSSVQFADL